MSRGRRGEGGGGFWALGVVWVEIVLLGCLIGYLGVSECWFWMFRGLAVLAAGICCGIMAVALGRGGEECVGEEAGRSVRHGR